MIRLSTNGARITHEQNTDTLKYIKKRYQNPNANLDDIKDRGIELCALMEKVLKDNEQTRQMLESYDLDQMQEITGEDNFDLDKESVKKLILKELSIGQVFYPGDIANEYNLDLKTVMDVMSELRASKHIAENLK